MHGAQQRPIPERHIDSPTFCHGVSGLLHTTLRFAQDTRLPAMIRLATALTEQVLRAFDTESLLGYYALEPGGKRVDQPGLLDGAAGVVLVLLAAASREDPSWDRLFLVE
jgi:hypothetical protein